MYGWVDLQKLKIEFVKLNTITSQAYGFWKNFRCTSHAVTKIDSDMEAFSSFSQSFKKVFFRALWLVALAIAKFPTEP